MPFITPITYLFLLPPSTIFADLVDSEEDAESSAIYAPLATEDVQDSEDVDVSKVAPIELSAHDKWRLLKPMLLKYMLPLCMFLFCSAFTLLTCTISQRLSRECTSSNYFK